MRCKRCEYEFDVTDTLHFCPKCGKKFSVEIENEYRRACKRIHEYEMKTGIWVRDEFLSATRRLVMQQHESEVNTLAQQYGQKNPRFDVLATEKMVEEWEGITMAFLREAARYIASKKDVNL